eukprot:gnl/MRDRNA2_/MRDRNA2_93670_c0_seq1.p1 gnl/MRDRNA2_/MRDRNA2_93670_c0~~gnl/MRDRNA2_/MRDRNA2_93670_c0_seq1.p1  ORF type:complete len:846 (+),score=133.24 gnl/MRDRNA2_/MRDRNA2_93670_c0_seq1:126-2540(+)
MPTAELRQCELKQHASHSVAMPSKSCSFSQGVGKHHFVERSIPSTSEWVSLKTTCELAHSGSFNKGCSESQTGDEGFWIKTCSDASEDMSSAASNLETSVASQTPPGSPVPWWGVGGKFPASLVTATSEGHLTLSQPIMWAGTKCVLQAERMKQQSLSCQQQDNEVGPPEQSASSMTLPNEHDTTSSRKDVAEAQINSNNSPANPAADGLPRSEPLKIPLDCDPSVSAPLAESATVVEDAPRNVTAPKLSHARANAFRKALTDASGLDRTIQVDLLHFLDMITSGETGKTETPRDAQATRLRKRGEGKREEEEETEEEEQEQDQKDMDEEKKDEEVNGRPEQDQNHAVTGDRKENHAEQSKTHKHDAAGVEQEEGLDPARNNQLGRKEPKWLRVVGEIEWGKILEGASNQWQGASVQFCDPDHAATWPLSKMDDCLGLIEQPISWQIQNKKRSTRYDQMQSSRMWSSSGRSCLSSREKLLRNKLETARHLDQTWSSFSDSGRSSTSLPEEVSRNDLDTTKHIQAVDRTWSSLVSSGNIGDDGGTHVTHDSMYEDDDESDKDCWSNPKESTMSMVQDATNSDHCKGPTSCHAESYHAQAFFPKQHVTDQCDSKAAQHSDQALQHHHQQQNHLHSTDSAKRCQETSVGGLSEASEASEENDSRDICAMIRNRCLELDAEILHRQQENVQKNAQPQLAQTQLGGAMPSGAMRDMKISSATLPLDIGKVPRPFRPLCSSPSKSKLALHEGGKTTECLDHASDVILPHSASNSPVSLSEVRRRFKSIKGGPERTAEFNQKLLRHIRAWT